MCLSVMTLPLFLYLQQQLLSGASGQLQAAAALLVELARAASAAHLAAQGSPAALTANTAAVLRGSGAGQLLSQHRRHCCFEKCEVAADEGVVAHSKGQSKYALRACLLSDTANEPREDTQRWLFYWLLIDFLLVP
jgi:hypothetical protein